MIKIACRIVDMRNTETTQTQLKGDTMKTATYQRKDTAIRGDIITAGGTRDVYHLEHALSPDTLDDRNEYRSRIEALAAKYDIPTRSTLPID